MRPRDFAAPLALLLACAACSNPLDPSDDELGRNVLRWQRQEVDDYRYLLTAGRCECLPQWIRPAEVVVFDDRTTVLRYLDNGSTDVWITFTRLARVEDLFAFVDDAYEQDAHLVEVDYDPTYGFPTRIYVDYDEQVADDELEVRVSDFTPVVGILDAG